MLKTFYLIYHPSREKTTIDETTIFHDNFNGNQDPYLWNDQFLHSFCHITQLKNEIGQVNFWVSANHYRDFSQLFCDCVFVISEKCYWQESNRIEISDPIVDNKQAFEHHYKWVNEGHHFFKGPKRRYTLKGDAAKSFQPQSKDQELIDILPFLESEGISKDSIMEKMTSKRGSRPLKIEDKIGIKLYAYLYEHSAIRILGKDIQTKHPKNS